MDPDPAEKPYACLITKSAADDHDKQSMCAVYLSKLGSSMQTCTLCGMLYTSGVQRGNLAGH